MLVMQPSGGPSPNRVWVSDNGRWSVNVISLHTSTLGEPYSTFASVVVSGENFDTHMSINNAGEIETLGMFADEVPQYVRKAAERFLRTNYERIREADMSLVKLNMANQLTHPRTPRNPFGGRRAVAGRRR